jgi:hypothetical protein
MLLDTPNGGIIFAHVNSSKSGIVFLMSGDAPTVDIARSQIDARDKRPIFWLSIR